MSISFENCRQEINIELFYAKRANFYECKGLSWSGKIILFGNDASL